MNPARQPTHPHELGADGAGDARDRHLGAIRGLRGANGDGTGGSLASGHGHPATKGSPGLGSGVGAASTHEGRGGSHDGSSHIVDVESGRECVRCEAMKTRGGVR